MDFSSIALTNFAASSPYVPATDVDSVETYCTVGIRVLGANEAVDVEGIVVDTFGMTFIDVVPRSLCFNWTKLSNSLSVSFN